MIKTEFGIIEDIEETQKYSYESEKYHCVYIDDEVYIDDWWEKQVLMKSYFHNLNRPEFGQARCGITLIPPESLIRQKGKKYVKIRKYDSIFSDEKNGYGFSINIDAVCWQ